MNVLIEKERILIGLLHSKPSNCIFTVPEGIVF